MRIAAKIAPPSWANYANPFTKYHDKYVGQVSVESIRAAQLRDAD
jgi:hypothetical protein